MGIRSLVSFGLFLVPIAITLGVLLGLDAYRASTGQTPVFGPSNKVDTQQWCVLSYGVDAGSINENFILNPNQWGVSPNAPNPGASCLYVDINENGSYATANSAPSWWVTWSYPERPASPVYGYPNVMVDPKGVLPVRISDLKNINVDLEWGYNVGNTPKTGIDSTGLTGVTATANIALDLFIDADPTTATNASAAGHEIMLWLGVFNFGTARPVGAQVSVPGATKEINGSTFNLWYGQNVATLQRVYSWVAASPTATFNGDIYPFVSAIQDIALTGEKFATTDYIGYISFGTETFAATSNVTFSVPKYEIELVR